MMRYALKEPIWNTEHQKRYMCCTLKPALDHMCIQQRIWILFDIRQKCSTWNTGQYREVNR